MSALDISLSCDLDLGCAMVVARDCALRASSPAFEEAMQTAIVHAAANDDEARRNEVRKLLRFGAYKPSGRGKPASEYLWQAARAGEFPRVFSLVDVCNLVSLGFGLPISLVDIARANADAFVVRRGRENENYVFNAGGQTIALADLLLLARASDDAPLANAVKDSLATKLTSDSRHVLGVVYAPKSLAAEAEAAAREMAKWFSEDFSARVATAAIV